jgi:hypothetical protein
MQLASILNGRSAYPLVLVKNASVAMNRGGRRWEERRGQHQTMLASDYGGLFKLVGTRMAQ